MGETFKKFGEINKKLFEEIFLKFGEIQKTFNCQIFLCMSWDPGTI